MTRIKQILTTWSERREKATPGRWVYKDKDKFVWAGPLSLFRIRSDANGEFIAASRTEHARLTKALGRAAEALENIKSGKAIADWGDINGDDDHIIDCLLNEAMKAQEDIAKILESEGE